MALVHLVLAVWYSVVVPPWESYDEMGHYYYAEYIARHKHLPPPDKQLAPVHNETHQPPLYYTLASLPIMLAVPDDGYQLVLNPYAKRADAAAGRNMAIHDPRMESFPWRGTILALHLARFVSVIIGTVGLWFTWRAARVLAPSAPAVAAIAVMFHALVPEYLFIGSVVTNDILVAVLTGAVSYFSLRLLLVPPRWTALLGLYTSLALALGTKYSAWSLVGPAVTATLISALYYRRTFFRETWKVLIPLAIVTAAGTAFWAHRNWVRWGTLMPPGYQSLLLRTVQEPREALASLPWHMAWPTVVYAYRTLWAAFGWGNVEPGLWVVYGFSTASVLALAGWIYGTTRRKVTTRQLAGGLWLLGTIAAIVIFFVLFALNKRTPHAAPARYMLGILSPLSVFLAFGWHTLLPRFGRWPATWMFASLLVLVNVYCLVAVIRPTYTWPRFLNSEDVQAWLQRPGVQVVNARFGDAIELVAYRQLTTEVSLEEYAHIEVLWRVLRPLPENYTLGVQILGRRLERYGELYLYPGRGTYPSSLWVPDTWFAETYTVPVLYRNRVPTRGVFGFSFFLNTPGFPNLPSYDAAGRPALVLVGELRIEPPPAAPLPEPEPLCSVPAEWGEGIRLIGVTLPPQQPLDAPAPLVLHWRATDTPRETWTVFLHVLTPQGSFVTGSDGPPQQGDFPTRLWRPGDHILDPRFIRWPKDIKPGQYLVTVGFYRPQDNTRLTVRQAREVPEPEGALVAWVEVTPDGQVAFRCP